MIAAQAWAGTVRRFWRPEVQAALEPLTGEALENAIRAMARAYPGHVIVD